MTHNTPTPETSNIVTMRKELTTHQEKATYRASKGMFYSAKVELNHCIDLAGKIHIELIRGA